MFVYIPFVQLWVSYLNLLYVLVGAFGLFWFVQIAKSVSR